MENKSYTIFGRWNAGMHKGEPCYFPPFGEEPSELAERIEYVRNWDGGKITPLAWAHAPVDIPGNVPLADTIEQCIAEAVAAGHGISAPNDEGWIEWKGGECPVAADTMVVVRSTDGQTRDPLKARMYRWYHLGGLDIIAYRVIEPAKAEPPEDVAGELAGVLQEIDAVYQRISDPNAAMIARDQPRRRQLEAALFECEAAWEARKRSAATVSSAPSAATPETFSTAKPALAALCITRDLGHQLSPGFGSALLG